MQYFVVVDTNILISAVLKPNSNPGLIIRLIDDNIIVPILNNYIVEEYVTVLNREKFGFTKNQITNIIELFLTHGIFEKKKMYPYKLIDEKDRDFLELYLESKDKRNTYLVTGNIKHYPMDFNITTPKSVCEIILRDYIDKNHFNI